MPMSILKVVIVVRRHRRLCMEELAAGQEDNVCGVELVAHKLFKRHQQQYQFG